eukprot:TRINITY_DN3196_c0_g1_i1.p1 TRINITY_DN3196_c0_g1~~TRINITY_DN3196_c0_g1_i1.p1  ORF type:complete len:621 (+),score=165.94 TRINITY_DN3196_c0_g1_i1:2465-4327(+)
MDDLLIDEEDFNLDELVDTIIASENHEENVEEIVIPTKNSIISLINCQCNKDLFDLSMDIMVQTMKEKAFDVPEDLISIILYNVDSTTISDTNIGKINDSSVVILDLAHVNSDSINTVKEMKQKVSEFGITENNVTVKQILHKCLLMFSSQSTQYNKSVWIFSEDFEDKNHVSIKNELDLLKCVNVEFSVFTNDNGDFSKYEDYITEDSIFRNPEIGKTDFFTKKYRQRPLSHANLILPSKTMIGFNVYMLNTPAKVPYREKRVTTINNQQYEVKHVYVNEETGEVLDKNELGRCVEVADKKAVFKWEELAKFNAVQKSGFQFIGFESLAKLPHEIHFKPGLFLRPDDFRISNSTNNSCCLFEAMRKKNVFMIVRGSLRKSISPKYYCLLIQPENNLLALSHGFWLYELPTIELRKKLDHWKLSTYGCSPDEEVLKLGKDMVHRLTIGESFHPFDFKNPKIQHFYKTLHSIALDEDFEVNEDSTEDSGLPVEDSTLITDEMLKPAENTIGSFFINADEHPMNGVIDADISKAKRTRKDVNFDFDDIDLMGSSSGTSRQIRAQTTDLEDIDDDQVKEMINSHKLNTLKVPQLKAILKNKGVKLGKMKKAELIEKILEVFTI